MLSFLVKCINVVLWVCYNNVLMIHVFVVFKLAQDKNLKIYQTFPESGNMGFVLPEYLSRWSMDKVKEGEKAFLLFYYDIESGYMCHICNCQNQVNNHCISNLRKQNIIIYSD